MLQAIVENRAREEGIASELLCRKRSLEALLRSKESRRVSFARSSIRLEKEVIGKDLLAFLERDG